jgi:hypothetical protein
LLFRQLEEAFSTGVPLFRLQVLLGTQQKIGIQLLLLPQRMLHCPAKSVCLRLKIFSTKVLLYSLVLLEMLGDLT